MTEAQKRAKKKYRAKIKRFTLEFCPTEKALIEWVNQQPQKQTYIKNLIRKDLQRDGE